MARATAARIDLPQDGGRRYPKQEYTCGINNKALMLRAIVQRREWQRNVAVMWTMQRKGTIFRMMAPVLVWQADLPQVWLPKRGMTSMRPVTMSVGLVSALALGACAVAPPQGPAVVAMPGQGKDMAAFQQDDAVCRQYASAQTGGMSAAEAGTNAGVGSAVLGTALGAAAGAALGSVGGAVGAGAAIGGATGLLAGSAIGAGNAQASAAGVQQRYDVSYAQCMTARGDQVQAPPPAYGGGYPYGYPYSYGYGYPPYYGWGPAWYGPSVSIGVGGGWGWGGWHGHHWH